MEIHRKLRQPVQLGIAEETVFAGDHIAYFYDSDAETVEVVSEHFGRVLEAARP